MTASRGPIRSSCLRPDMPRAFNPRCGILRARRRRPLPSSSVKATVGLGPRDAGGFGLKVDLEVALKGVSRAEAEELVSVAHNVVCPYSNALRGNVDVNVKVL